MHLQYLNKLLVGTVLLGSSATLLAETRYVSDQLRITVRSGQSTSHAVISTLDSGASVEVLQTDDGSGYTEVRLANGKRGWALSRYLLAEPIAQSRLAEAQEALTQTREKLAKIKPISDQQALQIEALNEERDQLASTLQQLRLQTADSVALIEKDKQLQTDLTRLTDANKELRQRVDVLSSDQRLRWFMYGGGVMAIGVLFGLLLPKLRIQRKAWNEF